MRAAYYVVSGNDPGSGEPSRAVLDALLEAKAQWGTNLQVLFDFTLKLNIWMCLYVCCSNPIKQGLSNWCLGPQGGTRKYAKK